MGNATIIFAADKSFSMIHSEIQALTVPPPLRILAEGDSWFSLFINRTDAFDGSNMLWHVETRLPSIIISLASTGDTLANVAGSKQSETLSLILEKRWGYEFNAILLSGGGNDIIDRLGALLRTPPSSNYGVMDCLNQDAVEFALNDLILHLEHIVRLRDQSIANGTTPIVIHTYDYITPRPLPFQFFVLTRGPWAYREMQRFGIHDPAVQKGITDFLLDAWTTRLIALEQRTPQFYVAITRGTLTPADPLDLQPTADWHDEIHPTSAGFVKLARRLNPVLATALASRS